MKYGITKEKYLLDHEQEQLNNVLNKFKDTNIRDTTMLWLLLYTGARATELLNVVANDLDVHNKSIMIKGLKGSDDRDIPLPDWLFDRAFSLAKTNERLFPITYNRMRQIWEIYRPAKKKLHSLRHSFAINVYRKTKDLRLLQIALGHKNWNNTMIYAKYQYKASELRRLLC